MFTSPTLARWSSVLCLVLSSMTVRASDWPQWGGRDDRNMASDEKGLPESFVPGKKSTQGTGIDLRTTQNVKWIARLGSQTYGNATIANGRVFIGTNDDGLRDPRLRPTRGGMVMCLDEATGKLLWQLPIPRFLTNLSEFNFDNINLGVCSSPTVDGNRVYVVTNRGEVVCLDVAGMANGNDGPFTDEGQFMAGHGNPPVPVQPTDGDIIWHYDMLGKLKIWPQDAVDCSVLIHGDLVYVCTSNGVDRSHIRVPSPLAPSLIVFDKRTGRLVATDNEKMGTRLFHGLWSSPTFGVVDGKELVFFGGGEGTVYAFEALASVPTTPVFLKKVWSYDCNPPEYVFCNGKKRVYVDGDVRKHRANKNDGQYIGPSEIIGTPVLYKNRIYVTVGQDPLHGRGRGMLSCIDAATGRKIWACDRIGRSLATVSIADGLLYVADTFEGIYCFDAETGQQYWFQPLNSEVWGSTFVADGKVYLGTKKSLIVMAAGKEPKQLADIHLGAPSFCTPVVANGVLYVASQRYLWAVQMNKTSPATPLHTVSQ